MTVIQAFYSPTINELIEKGFEYCKSDNSELLDSIKYGDWKTAIYVTEDGFIDSFQGYSMDTCYIITKMFELFPDFLAVEESDFIYRCAYIEGEDNSEKCTLEECSDELKKNLLDNIANYQNKQN